MFKYCKFVSSELGGPEPSEEEVTVFINEIDSNHDGKVSKE